MIIASSDIQLSSQHSSIEKHTLQESLKTWVGDQRPDFEGRQSQGQVIPPPLANTVNLSARGLAAAKVDPGQQANAVNTQTALENDPRYQLIIMMVEALTGQKIRLFNPADIQQPPSTTQAQAPTPTDPNQAATPAQPKPAGFGVEYDRHETSYEAEQTSFSAQGTVKTADGKEISFTLNLSMSREHTEQSDVSVRLGDAKKKDPLVINFNGTAAQLTDTKFSFDLNSTGQADQISFVGPSSGFLALDKNGDGKINNGSELFGPATGNGFQELAAYDLDKNGWIDENDAVYKQLKVWTKDGSGNDTLSTLAQKKVGAIYLGNVSTPFDLKNGQNQLDGQVKSSGVYLDENGGAGTVQQIDLAV